MGILWHKSIRANPVETDRVCPKFLILGIPDILDLFNCLIVLVVEGFTIIKIFFSEVCY